MWALLPIKNISDAKQRLANLLSAEERGVLFKMMVQDVLSVLANHPQLSGVTIVSDDPLAYELAEQYSIDFLTEKSIKKQLVKSNTNSNILSGIARAAVNHLAKKGIDDVMIIHGDLPLINADELSDLIKQHSKLTAPSITLSPDRHRKGTNCLLLSKLPEAFRFQYGENSFNKHQQQAQSLSLSNQVIEYTGISCDIDYADDLSYLLEKISGDPLNTSNTKQFLTDANIKQRLSVDLAGFKSTLPTNKEALALASANNLNKLMTIACELRDDGFNNVMTYSRKVFIPITQLCRDVCHYCTFAKTPKKIESPYMSLEQVLKAARDAQKMGCKEALFTLGERPELRYKAARDALQELGFSTTLEYVAYLAEQVMAETDLLVHINAGCMSIDEIQMLRPVSASMGIMLESASERLCEKGMPHYGSPDKAPVRRLETIELAGQEAVPFTSGILIGIGETRLERIESLLALRDLHQQYGHLQEIIIQNFRAKEGTKMVSAPEPDLADLQWTIAVARIIFGPEMSIQAPPNLSPGMVSVLIDAGINDWGGISPVTPDFVNPEAPWPNIKTLSKQNAQSDKHLQERLTIYPRYAINPQQWLDEKLHRNILQKIDSQGFPRIDDWFPGHELALPEDVVQQISTPVTDNDIAPQLRSIVASAKQGNTLSEQEIVRLFAARGAELGYIAQQANQLRAQTSDDTVRYVVNRNINYTNVCYFKCQFCAFSKGKLSENLRGKPYDLDLDEIKRRVAEAWQRGATEVCMQGGIHPGYTGQTYLDILGAVKSAAPQIHVHAFSPLEVWQGAKTLGISITEFLQQLKHAGLGSLPGTAAEILDEEVRQQLCPDKINTAQWTEVIEAAHAVGLPTTATIMFGHIDQPKHWARHLLHIRKLQSRTGGFTEFVPLPFVHMEAPLYLKGKARKGPTFRESTLMHSVARLVLHTQINNIQVSWVKLGNAGVQQMLNAGSNDLGGTLMNETITRAAGASHGQEKTPGQMHQLINSAERKPEQRTTLYKSVAECSDAIAEQLTSSFNNLPLADVVNTPLQKIKVDKTALVMNKANKKRSQANA